MLNRKEALKLIKIARESIDACLNETTQPEFNCLEERLREKRGCFVTIEMQGHLRGCIGTFTSDLPLFEEVAKNAVSAATADPRFYAMTGADIGQYTLDISILSPLEKIEDTELIEVGTHGIYLENDISRGVLLPQVATQFGWDRQTFLEQTCVKAGLPTDAWSSPRTRIYIFSAQVISEQVLSDD